MASSPHNLSPTVPATPADVAVIGGGPVGLFATFYAGMRKMSVTLIDSLPQLGGQLAALYPEKRIYDSPGFPAVSAKELVANLVRQAMHARPRLVLQERVAIVSQDSSGLFAITTDRDIHAARSVIIAGGLGALSPRRLPVENADTYDGKGLAYSLENVEELRGRQVVIVGGGDLAVEWAIAAASVAAHTTLIHRRDRFRSSAANIVLLHQSPVELHLCHEVRALTGRGQVESVTIEDILTSERRTLPVEIVLTNLGFESSLGALRDWGLALHGSTIAVDPMMQSSRPGIFAVGDICSYQGKLKLLATGFGEAATAINFAKCFLDPTANPFPGHSTSVAPTRMRMP